MSRGPIAVLAGAVAVLLLAASPAGAELRTKRCPKMPEFGCATVTVPIDRAGSVPGTIDLKVAAEPPRRSDKGVVLALSGGPGQGAVGFMRDFVESLAPLLEGRRLVAYDQRGTGDSSLIDCPALQRVSALDPVRPSLIADCAQAIGPQRRFFGTIDTVADIEALREALGAEKLTIMGISYGTYVAQQYARVHPGRVERLVLDSVLSDEGFDPFLLDSLSRMSRVLREQCRRDRCRRTTKDPVGDVRALVAKLASAPLRGRIPDRRGRMRSGRLDHTGRLFLLVLGGDLNPFLQPSLPGALAAARRGDTAPILRAARLAQGPPESARSFSLGLNVTTACADGTLPYDFSQSVPDRAARLQSAIDGLGPDVADPFDVAAMRSVSIAEDCLLWPQGDAFQGPSTAPMPDVPTLMLSGRLDMRTPFEDAEELLGELPRAQLVRVPGTGHDVLGADLTGCTALALDRFARGRRVGSPCKGATNQVPVYQLPPRALRHVRRIPAVPGRRGRVVEAVLETVSDAQLTAVATAFAGFKRYQGGGLRGGWFSATGLAEVVRMRRYSYIPGVQVSGRIDADGGRVRVCCVRGASGVLRLDGNGGVRGQLGGRRIRLSARQTDVVLATASRTGPAAAPTVRDAARVALRQWERYRSSGRRAPSSGR